MKANLGRMGVQKFISCFGRVETNLPAKRVEDRKHGLKKKTWVKKVL